MGSLPHSNSPGSIAAVLHWTQWEEVSQISMPESSPTFYFWIEGNSSYRMLHSHLTMLADIISRAVQEVLKRRFTSAWNYSVSLPFGRLWAPLDSDFFIFWVGNGIPNFHVNGKEAVTTLPRGCGLKRGIRLREASISGSNWSRSFLFEFRQSGYGI